jgi:LPXTG-motif cell wall-anchored protein
MTNREGDAEANVKLFGLGALAGFVMVITLGLVTPAGAVDYPPTFVKTESHAIQRPALATDPAPALPRTGGDVTPLAWLGAALVGSGVVFGTRNRRRSIDS